MDNPYMANASAYLIDAVSTVFLVLVALRFLLQLARADFYNPLSQFIVKVTNPFLKPLRRIIPGWGGIDFASVVLLLIVQTLALLLTFLAIGKSIHVSALMVLSVAALISLILNCYLMTILIQVILSWVGPHHYNPITALLYSLNEPVLRPARRIIPPISGIDFSPFIVLIVIQLAKILIVAPIMDVGRSLG